MRRSRMLSIMVDRCSCDCNIYACRLRSLSWSIGIHILAPVDVTGVLARPWALPCVCRKIEILVCSWERKIRSASTVPIFLFTVDIPVTLPKLAFPTILTHIDTFISFIHSYIVNRYCRSDTNILERETWEDISKFKERDYDDGSWNEFILS